MKRLLIFSIIAYCFAVGCKKENLGDLEFNKWENDVPNFISVDSSRAEPVSPSYGDIWVYISFNETYIEQEWNTIKLIHVVYQKYSFGSPLGNIVLKTVPFSNGYGVFEPLSTNNNTTYKFQFYIEFENGRTSLWSPAYTILTPPF